VLAAGPGLAAGEPEIAALAVRYPDACVLGPGRAADEDVRRALDGAALAHVAAHGTFRADNPLFSALHLDDGPLTVYDLEALERAPRVLVLSACDSGLSAVRPGDELMGLAAAVFALGTRTLVASVVPVPDAASRDLMIAFHDGLLAGRTPATALAAAQRDRGIEGAGFVCFGAG
jgi:CHAT domain-containing protein